MLSAITLAVLLVAADPTEELKAQEELMCHIEMAEIFYHVSSPEQRQNDVYVQRVRHYIKSYCEVK